MEGPEPLAREITALGIWLLVVNGMIGAGIFGVPAGAARLTGVFSPWMFVLCGLLIAPVILSFGEVSSYFRGTGGPVRYTQTAFGPFVGFQTGWALYVARVTAFAANINLLVSSVAYFWSGADQGVLRLVLLFAISGGLTLVNVTGTKDAMRSLGVLTVLKFIPLVLLVVVGLPRTDLSVFVTTGATLPSYTNVGAAALFIIYAYVGWESALIPAGEARAPARDMPRALLWGLGVVAVLYLLIQAVSVAVLPELAASERPLVDVAHVLLGPVGALILTVGVVVSVGGNIASAMFTAPRMTYMLAREGSLPAWLGSVHPRFQTPMASIVLYGTLTFLLASVGTFAWLALISSVTRLLTFVLCIGAIPRLRSQFGDAPDRFHLPGGYAIPLLGMAVCLWLLAQVNQSAVGATAVFLVVGTVLYGIARWRLATPPHSS